MPYNSQIPQPTDQINNSQPQLLGNFQAIDTYVNVNHVDFDDPNGDEGKHKWVAYPTENYTPPVNGDITLYGGKVDSVTNVRECTLITSGGRSVPMSSSILSISPTPAQGTAGWSFFPSGIIARFTQCIEFSSGGVKTINLTLNDVGFQPFSVIMKVFLTTLNPAGTSAGNITSSLVAITGANQIQIYLSGAGRVNMLIIGY